MWGLLTKIVIYINTNKKICIYLGLVTIFLVGALMRLDALNDAAVHVYHSDPNRDFLIANQMLSYGEFPITGPDGYLGSNANSPFYYYLVAFLIFFSEKSVYALNVSNLFLQTFSGVMLYFLVKNFFDKKAAIITFSFFFFFNIFIQQSVFMWQPHSMQLFYIGALLCLSQYFKRPNTYYLLAGIALFCCATTLHNSALALVPSFAVLVFTLLFVHKSSMRTYCIVALFGVFTELLLYSSTVYLFFSTEVVSSGAYSFSNALHISSDWFTVGLSRWNSFFDYYFNNVTTVQSKFLLYGIILLSTIWYLVTIKDVRKRNIFLVILFTCISIIPVVSSVSNVADFIPFPMRYWSPMYVPFTLLIAVALSRLHTILYIGPLLQWTAVITIIYFASPIFGSENVLAHLSKNVYTNPIGHFILPENRHDFLNEANVIIAAVQENKLEANFDITSFRIEGDNFGIDIYTNEEIWTPLEITMKKKYVTLDHTYSRGYRPLHYPEYMFVRCPEISSDQCQILIDTHLPGYRIYKDITATKVPMYLLYTVR